MQSQRIRIRLKAFDYRLIDQSALEIVDTAKRTGAVVRLTDASGTTSLGVDGLVLDRQSLIGVQNGLSPARIARFRLTPDGAGISRVDVLDRQPGVADEPTIGTLLHGGYLYVANSQWEKYDDAGQRRDGTRLAPTHLIRIPLSP